MLRIAAILLLTLLLIPVTFIHGDAPPKNQSQIISLEPLPLRADRPGVTRIGSLTFLGAWRLSSENSSFGGFSAMHVAPGNRFLLLSDAGALAGFTLDEERDRALRPFIAPLPAGPVPPNAYAQQNWDAESLQYDPATKHYWIGFEQQHSIWRYAPSFAKAEAHHRPKAWRKWPDNGGVEALLRLPDGRFLAFSEGEATGKGRYAAAIFAGDPAEATTPILAFGYRPPSGYAITDAAMLPDGRALLLHRRFRPHQGVKTILSVADPAAVKPGATWSATPILRLSAPYLVDNMEALAVTQEDGETILWLASDDNFNPVQQSILMKFALPAAPTGKDGSGQKKTGPVRPGFETLR
jgi:hypothetical protein